MRRKTGGSADRDGWDPQPLEIEFEDGDAGEDGGASAGANPTQAGQENQAPPAPTRRAWRARRAIGAVVVIGVVAVAAVMAAHDDSGSGAPPPSGFIDDNSEAVRITYLNSRLVSLPKHQLDVRLNIAPAQDQPVKITEISVSEGGVAIAPISPTGIVDVPTPGLDLTLRWTVTNCGNVPMDESMAYVEVITESKDNYIMDRFTILGDRYSADISRLLHQLCGSGTASPTAPGPATTRATGPLSTVS
jgi:hypothetical protein